MESINTVNREELSSKAFAIRQVLPGAICQISVTNMKIFGNKKLLQSLARRL